MKLLVISTMLLYGAIGLLGGWLWNVQEKVRCLKEAHVEHCEEKGRDLH
jgi:hypothetical protein